MPNLPKLLLTVFLCLLLQSCGKNNSSFNGTSSVEGTVVDAVSGKGIPNASVGLVRQKSGSFGYGAAGHEQIDGVKADANGNFSFNFSFESGYVYGVMAEAGSYLDNTNEVTVNAGDNKNIHLSLQPYGYVKFLFQNQHKDTVTVILNGCDCSFTGTKDTSIIVNAVGNEKQTFMWEIYGGKIGYRQDSTSIYVKAHDTVSYAVAY
jgi:hypothetical protein